MNPTEYAEKAVTVEEPDPFLGLSADEFGSVVLRSGYPQPEFGVTLFNNHRGMANNGVDWAASRLRRGIAALIVHVAEDCIDVVSRVEGVNENQRAMIEGAIRKQFEILLH